MLPAEPAAGRRIVTASRIGADERVEIPTVAQMQAILRTAAECRQTSTGNGRKVTSGRRGAAITACSCCDRKGDDAGTSVSVRVALGGISIIKKTSLTTQ